MFRSVRAWFRLGLQVNLPIKKPLHMLTDYSLTQEASLREVDNLRQQIYRIKGGDTASTVLQGNFSS